MTRIIETFTMDHLSLALLRSERRGDRLVTDVIVREFKRREVLRAQDRAELDRLDTDYDRLRS